MGRHSASDDDDERPVVTTVPGRAPRPGRHTDDDAAMAADAVRVRPGPNPRLEPARAPSPTPAPRPEPTAGLDLIEDVLYGPDQATEDATAGPQDATVQLPMITAPLLDEPVSEALTGQIPVVSADDVPAQDAAAAKPNPKPAPAPPVATDEPAAAAPEPTRDPVPAATDARSDLALLRTRSDVRARVLAAAVIPFVLYVLVLLAVDALTWRILLIWIWAPLVTAGVLAGVLLDSAQREPDPTPDETSDKPPVTG